MHKKLKPILMTLAGCLCLVVAIRTMFICHSVLWASNDVMDSKIESIMINGIPYIHGESAPVELITDEVFQFEVVVKNTGTTTWGGSESAGEHGASLLSRGDQSHDINDYNETFGTFIIIYPMQFGIPFEPEKRTNSPRRLPGEAWDIKTILRAPCDTGRFTMRWQTAQYPIGQNRGYNHLTETRASARNSTNNYFNRPFFGQEIVVDFIIIQRTEQAPVPTRRPGVLDRFDFQYEGSFAMPQLWRYSDRFKYGLEDEKSFNDTGIALRKVEISPGVYEKRMLATTGTFFADTNTRASRLYEVAVPAKPGKIIGTDISAAPTAEVRTIFEGQSNLMTAPKDTSVSYWEQAGLWFDEETKLLYWTNAPYYIYGTIKTPSIFSARLAGNEVVDRKVQWDMLWGSDGGPRASFMFGITGIPKSISNQYFGGRKLALGFGGGSEGSYSKGPAIYAVSTNGSGDIQSNILSIMYQNTGISNAVRDGNFLPLEYWEQVPKSPWEGNFMRRDKIRNGIFMDYGGKKGYLTFPRQGIGRVGYDFGGPNFFGKYQDTWYFYDIDDLSKAVNGQIPKNEIKPSSYNVIEYPTGRPAINYEYGAEDRIVSGSCFDQETGLLYIYVKRGKDGNDPFIHVYRILEGDNDYAPAFYRGNKTMTLPEGYQATETQSFHIMAKPTASVTTSGNTNITWDNATNKLKIAPGLAKGVYPVTLTANNGINVPTTFIFTLRVVPSSASPAPASQVPPQQVPPQQVQQRSGENIKSCPLALFLIQFTLFIGLK